MTKNIPIVQPDFKPVYIFGAGTSSMIGGPLLDDFLGKARTLLHGREIEGAIAPILLDQLKLCFRRVFDYQDKLYRTRQFLGIDVGNLETLFSILDMEWQTIQTGIPTASFTSSPYNNDELKQIRESLFCLIVATLKMTVNERNAVFNNLIKILSSSENSSFITFNYDLSIERALAPSFSTYYGFDEIEPEELEPTVKRVFKLHGSVNWTFCQDCHRVIHHLNYISPLDLQSIDLPNHHKDDCTHKNGTLNLILPPTWYKYNYLDAITRIWRRSIRELSIATHIFIVGYSFPMTDVFFDQMLTLGLRENQNLKKIIIVDPSERIQPIIEDFFDKHFLRRSVVFLKTGIEQIAGHLFNPVINEKQIDELLYSLRSTRII
jgi:NAD-dependent SIR2 family protein deacetylase